jgi:hypothetical protein
VVVTCYSCGSDEASAEICLMWSAEPGSASIMLLSGRALIGAELGARLGVTDPDGGTPLSLRYELGGPPEPHPDPRLGEHGHAERHHG